MALILLLVCRNTITCLRSAKLSSFVPFDDNINFHMTVAAAIVTGITLHVGNHLVCDFPKLIRANSTYYQKYLVNDFGPSKPWYIDLVKGVEGVMGLIMVILMAIAFTLAMRWFRKSLITLPKHFDRLTGFNAFWYSHHFFVIVYILLVIHGTFFFVHKWYSKTTWMYLAVPILLYAGERTRRFFRLGLYTVRLLKITDHGVENISGKYSFSSNVHGNIYGVIEAKEGVNNPPIMSSMITPGGTLDLSTVFFRSRIIFIGTPINSAVA
ncbi:hypothetical protein P3L10_022793 [Capsicum annuum]